jgi:hypothetical protein
MLNVNISLVNIAMKLLSLNLKEAIPKSVLLRGLPLSNLSLITLFQCRISSVYTETVFFAKMHAKAISQGR